MDLILWRHAEAEDAQDGSADLDRALTARGQKQATKVAAWLDRQLPESSRILVSPARRTEQTALALGRKFKLRAELGPDATPAQVLELVQWPQNKSTVVIVGHQPVLGQIIAQLVGLQASECSVKKGMLWWLRTRVRDGENQAVVVTVQSADTV
jgi:phosphohistidine phosphatase